MATDAVYTSGILDLIAAAGYIGTYNVNEDWREEALCAQTDPDLFFPVDPDEDDPGETRSRGSGPHGSREAKRVCAACPVKEECLDYALDHHIKFGIWGETTPKDRRKIWSARHNA